MNLADTIILTLTVIAFCLALRHTLRQRKKGDCGCGCGSCSSTRCSIKTAQQHK